jgi:hypothetical protein
MSDLILYLGKFLYIFELLSFLTFLSTFLLLVVFRRKLPCLRCFPVASQYWLSEHPSGQTLFRRIPPGWRRQPLCLSVSMRYFIKAAEDGFKGLGGMLGGFL